MSANTDTSIHQCTSENKLTHKKPTINPKAFPAFPTPNFIEMWSSVF